MHVQEELDDINSKTGIDVATQTGETSSSKRRSLVALSAEIAHDMSRSSASSGPPAPTQVPLSTSPMGLTRRGSIAGSLAASLSRVSVGGDMAAMLEQSYSSTGMPSDEAPDLTHAKSGRLTRRGSTAGGYIAMQKFSVGPDLAAEVSGAMHDDRVSQSSGLGTETPRSLMRRGSTIGMAAFQRMTGGHDTAAEGGDATGLAVPSSTASAAEVDTPRSTLPGLTRRGSIGGSPRGASVNFSVGPDMGPEIASSAGPASNMGLGDLAQSSRAPSMSGAHMPLPTGLSRRTSNLGAMAASMSKMFMQQTMASGGDVVEDRPEFGGVMLPSLTGSPSVPMSPRTGRRGSTAGDLFSQTLAQTAAGLEVGATPRVPTPEAPSPRRNNRVVAFEADALRVHQPQEPEPMRRQTSGQAQAQPFIDPSGRDSSAAGMQRPASSKVESRVSSSPLIPASSGMLTPGYQLGPSDPAAATPGQVSSLVKRQSSRGATATPQLLPRGSSNTAQIGMESSPSSSLSRGLSEAVIRGQLSGQQEQAAAATKMSRGSSEAFNRQHSSEQMQLEMPEEGVGGSLTRGLTEAENRIPMRGQLDSRQSMGSRQQGSGLARKQSSGRSDVQVLPDSSQRADEFHIRQQLPDSSQRADNVRIRQQLPDSSQRAENILIRQQLAGQTNETAAGNAFYQQLSNAPGLQSPVATRLGPAGQGSLSNAELAMLPRLMSQSPQASFGSSDAQGKAQGMRTQASFGSSDAEHRAEGMRSQASFGSSDAQGRPQGTRSPLHGTVSFGHEMPGPASAASEMAQAVTPVTMLAETLMAESHCDGQEGSIFPSVPLAADAQQPMNLLSEIIGSGTMQSAQDLASASLNQRVYSHILSDPEGIAMQSERVPHTPRSVHTQAQSGWIGPTAEPQFYIAPASPELPSLAVEAGPWMLSDDLPLQSSVDVATHESGNRPVARPARQHSPRMMAVSKLGTDQPPNPFGDLQIEGEELRPVTSHPITHV